MPLLSSNREVAAAMSAKEYAARVDALTLDADPVHAPSTIAVFLQKEHT
jgi:hypothetical protein